MSTILVFDPVSDLAAAQTADDAITLTWSAATARYAFQNGGAETEDTTGWTTTLGGTLVSAPQGTVPGKYINPKEGTRVFAISGTNSRTLAVQRISPLCMGLTVDDIAEGKNITLKYWLGSSDQTASESVRLSKYFYDAAGSLIGSEIPAYTNPGVAPPPTQTIAWADEVTDVITIPSGTCFIDLEMDIKRNNGIGNNGHLDDIRVTLEDAMSLPFVPGYAIYQDGVLVAVAPPESTEFTVSGLALGDYEFQVVVCDSPTYLYDDASINFLSDASNTASATIASSGDSETHPLFGFADEQVFVGYLGGHLHGTTVACPGENANKVKPCC